MVRAVVCILLAVSWSLGQTVSIVPEDSGHDQAQLYNGYKVIRAHVETLQQLDYLLAYADEADNEGHRVNFWTKPLGINATADLMVSPQAESEVKNKLAAQNIKTETLIDNVGRIMEKEKDVPEKALLYLPQNTTLFFSKYQSLSNIYYYLDEIVRSYPDLASLETIGTTSEGRVMKIIKIGIKNDTQTTKPIVWVDAGIHAREWIAPATALYLTNKLVNHENDPEIVPLLRQFDFHILPSANPDGYEYSRNIDRFWRKTRSRNRNSILGLFCWGVDPNRNYGFQWKKAGSSSNPCSNTYHGPYPFSEPETKAISDHVLRHSSNIKLFVSLHSYSQVILTPWGYTHELPKAYADLVRIAQVGARALKMRYGTEYDCGNSPSILYLAAGGSDDWAHGSAGIKYSYTFELRDKGNFGFLLPPRFIVPTGQETVDAIVAILNEIKKEL